MGGLNDLLEGIAIRRLGNFYIQEFRKTYAEMQQKITQNVTKSVRNEADSALRQSLINEFATTKIIHQRTEKYNS